MPITHPFAAFLTRVQFEPVIRREVRMRLTDSSLCQLMDFGHICQSVLRNFLLTMAQNKVAAKAHMRCGPWAA